MSEPAASLVKYVLNTKFEDCSPAAIRRAEVALIDTVAATIAGSTAEAVDAVRMLAVGWGGAAESSVLVFGDRLPTPLAALVNATMARARDFDDTYELAPSGGHASAYLVPTALAVAERDSTMNGAELLTALVVGTDVYCRLAASVRADSIETGRDNMFSIFGPTLLAARLLRLNEDEAQSALGIAYVQAAGEMQMYEEAAHTIRLQQGLRARAGIEAAMFAGAGVRGPHQVFTGRYGFFRVFEPHYDLNALVGELGSRFASAEISFKPYPCCKCAHPAIEATLAIRSTHAFSPEIIESIHVGTNRSTQNFLAVPRETKWTPRTSMDAQFSLPYVVAVAAAQGHVRLDAFEAPVLADPAVRRLVARVSVDVDSDIERVARGMSNAPAVVTIRLTNGVQHTARVDFPRGHPKNPATVDDAERKLRECARYAARPFSEPQLAAFSAAVRELHGAADLRALWAGLRSGSGAKH